MTLAFLGSIENFLSEIFTSLASRGVDVSRYELDHLCYRVETSEEYTEMKRKLSLVSDCLGEPTIGGRSIATYKLRAPFVFEVGAQQRSIACIELPFPKLSSHYRSGLEHAEFVIDESFETFIARHPHLVFETKGMVKKHNPEIELEFGHYAVKFHYMSLEEVIALESGD